jgi:hypothetical protein
LVNLFEITLKRYNFDFDFKYDWTNNSNTLQQSINFSIKINKFQLPKILESKKEFNLNPKFFNELKYIN